MNRQWKTCQNLKGENASNHVRMARKCLPCSQGPAIRELLLASTPLTSYLQGVSNKLTNFTHTPDAIILTFWGQFCAKCGGLGWLICMGIVLKMWMTFLSDLSYINFEGFWTFLGIVKRPLLNCFPKKLLKNFLSAKTSMNIIFPPI